MNYLAHLYLSGSDEALRFGNFIGDAVKGNKYVHFPKPIQEGIILHRKIDSFTDHHPIYKETKQLFRPIFGHYKGVILDVINDHFLSLQWEQYHPYPLNNYLLDFEKTFQTYAHHLTPEAKHFYEMFISRKFMHQYDTFDGLGLTLLGMERRIGYKAPLSQSIDDLKTHYAHFENAFQLFFSEIQEYCKLEINKMNSEL
jgi:acyl carrier protein phosphodiesterase